MNRFPCSCCGRVGCRNDCMADDDYPRDIEEPGTVPFDYAKSFADAVEKRAAEMAERDLRFTQELQRRKYG